MGSSKLKPEQGETAMKVDRIPPFFVRFFPNTEGIRVGSTVRIVRDTERKKFVVRTIELPDEFKSFSDHIEDSKSLGELLGRYNVERAILLMHNKLWLYQFAVEMLNYDTEIPRRVHPFCLCLARNK